MNHAEQLQAITAGMEAVTSGLDLTTVLQNVTDASRRLVRARYAALGVLDEQGERIEQFITSGMDDFERRAIGDPPQGRGLLGHIIHSRQPLRVADMQQDFRAAGFPPHHPVMTSLLGVPIISGGRVFGNLYLTDKEPLFAAPGDDPAAVAPFTAADQAMVELFARQAAIAIENALLHRRSRQLAVAQERERFAMDLHDGIIQAIYGIGLTLDESPYQLSPNPETARAGIDQSIADLNDVIADLRSYILNLRTRRLTDQDLTGGLESLVQEARAHSFLSFQLQIDPDAAAAVSATQSAELLYIVQEALSNVRKHAQAKAVTVALTQGADELALRIQDDGVGFDAAAAEAAGGDGLGNMRARASALDGRLEVQTDRHKGTSVTVHIPFQPEV